jgi:hypothetical protein
MGAGAVAGINRSGETMHHYLKIALIAVVAVAVTKRVQGMVGVAIV